MKGELFYPHMDDNLWLNLLILLILLLGAMYCASAEIAFASLNVIRAKKLADEGDKRAKRALYILDNFEKALTTLLIGNNITHIGFASVATLIATKLWGVGSVTYMTLVSTIIVFFVSEMIPKSYAKSNFNYAMTISGSLVFLMKLFTPLSYFFTLISVFVSKLFKESDNKGITEEDFYTILKTVNEEGVLQEDKQELINSAIVFDVKKVKDAYAPLDNVELVDITKPVDEIAEQIKKTKYSRLPVYRGKRENIIGILHTKQFLRAYIKKKDMKSIKELLRKTIAVNHKAPIDNVLHAMSSRRNHISLVLDDHSKVIGIITLEDILEELVGEIWDEEDLKELSKGAAV